MHHTDRSRSESRRSRESVNASAPSDLLTAWLDAEANGEEAHSERALLELLSHLPEAQPEPKAARSFAQRVVERIENDARSNRWSLNNAVTLLAASVLACWIGAIVYAGLLGVDPTRISSLSGLVGDGARAIVGAPQFAVEVLMAGGSVVQEARAATAWAYSPWSLGFALASLLLAAVVLGGLQRMYPARGRGGYDASSVGAT